MFHYESSSWPVHDNYEECCLLIGETIVNNMGEENFKKYRKAGWNFFNTSNRVDSKKLWWLFSRARHYQNLKESW